MHLLDVDTGLMSSNLELPEFFQLELIFTNKSSDRTSPENLTILEADEILA